MSAIPECAEREAPADGAIPGAIPDESFHVPGSLHWLSGLVDRWTGLWKAAGRLESLSLADSLERTAIDRPLYVAGLARSGSTILLEALAAHRAVTTHQYRDFPCLFTPCWWQRIRQSRPSTDPVQRAHADGLMVTPQSPEAMEEVLWQAFFPQAHDTRRSQVLDESVEAPLFERFYRDHIRKLLYLRGGTRYAAKGNYNVTRLRFLQRLFPEARFLVPVRRPLNHIASLMKQHRLFVRAERRFPRVLAHMRRSGHYEFGLDRRPINPGHREATVEIERLWATGDEVRGWARYWALLYGWMADQLEEHPRLSQATEVIRFEDLCDQPAETLERIRRHADLPADSGYRAFVDRVRAPAYYEPSFSDAERFTIEEETSAVAARFGY